jgi:hypothetical protein
MSRITITDLPKDMHVTSRELRDIVGGRAGSRSFSVRDDDDDDDDCEVEIEYFFSPTDLGKCVS